MKELADFIDLPEKEQQKIMLKVIDEACRMQRETILPPTCRILAMREYRDIIRKKEYTSKDILTLTEVNQDLK